MYRDYQILGKTTKEKERRNKECRTMFLFSQLQKLDVFI